MLNLWPKYVHKVRATLGRILRAPSTCGAAASQARQSKQESVLSRSPTEHGKVAVARTLGLCLSRCDLREHVHKFAAKAV